MSQGRLLFFLAAVSFALGGITAALIDKRVVFIERNETASIQKAGASHTSYHEQSLLRAETAKANSLSGVECNAHDRRPFAVVIAEDEEARPLSGVGLADLVVEMPVVTGSITRMVALFVCEEPKEIGSVRSARHDFIEIASGYDAILAHWGGSHFALEELSKKAVDNLDALPNYFDAFFRKNWIPAPHNGFTSMRRLVYAAQSLGYRPSSNFSGYTFIEEEARDGGRQALTIGYIYPYNVKYEYNPETNLYYRWRGGKEEVDKVSQLQVAARNIVIMRAKSRQIEGDYNDVDMMGSGEAAVYRNGEEIKGSWEKKSEAGALRFYNKKGEEISFARGPIWIEVAEPSTIVNYTL